MFSFTLYWLDGTREVIKGDSIANALRDAGYGGGALRALDFYAEGVDDKYVWSAKERTWRHK